MRLPPAAKNKDSDAVKKPTCVLEYNKSMGGVDLMDQQLDSLLVIRKSYKWYKKVFLPGTPAVYAEHAQADAAHGNETRLPGICSRFSNAAADVCATPQLQCIRVGQCYTSDRPQPLSVQVRIPRHGLRSHIQVQEVPCLQRTWTSDTTWRCY